MAPDFHWTQEDAAGRLTPDDRIRAIHVAELAEAINRRRRLVYQHEQDFSAAVAPGGAVGRDLISNAGPPPLTNFRTNVQTDILNAPAGVLGGSPPSPARLDWLWPVDDGDEGKVLVNGFGGLAAGEVSLFDKLNGAGQWSDSPLTPGVSPVRATHLNELRQALEWIARGRWVLPMYLSTGLYSAWPDQPWTGEKVFNDGGQELRTLGYATLTTDDSPPRGLAAVWARAGSTLTITADADCTIEVYRCLRTIEFVANAPTWNHYDPAGGGAWAAPGGADAGDAESVGTLACVAGTPVSLTGAALAAAFQAMIDGAPQNWLIRRVDTAAEVVNLTAELAVEFDLDTPPN